MSNNRWRVAVTVAAGVVLWLGAARAEAQQTNLQTMTVQAHQPCEVSFTPQTARFVRVLVHRSSQNQVCIDELEVYGSDTKTNLALASRGAEASASSCLPGYAIHQVQHLNDGVYGNAHSWIAAQANAQWAQIALPQEELVSRVVISRDREGKYSDRVAVLFDVLLSSDGRHWTTVCRVQAKLLNSRPAGSGYAGPYHLSADASWDQKLEYAFLCERHTWSQMSSNDHLSPLQTDRPALPGGPPYWSRIARLDPLSRTLVQMGELIDRLAVKEVDVELAREKLLALRTQQQLASHAADPGPALDQLYLAARRAKRELMLADPDLQALRRVLFVQRHPYLSSHNYSDVLDSTFTPGGGVCLLEIPDRDGQLRPAEATVTTLFDASDGIARDAMADFDASQVYFAYRPTFSSHPGWEPYWHLMVLSLRTGKVTQLTDGPFHDYYPCPLSDGTLAFISTRCKARFLCWRPQAFVLYRMNADGSEIRPLSHANLSEWTPSQMRDGRILWTRSEYLDKGADFGHTLWAIRPDGTHPELIFGNNTPNCYINAREVPGTGEVCCTLFSHGGDHNGPIGLVNCLQGPFETSSITNITPDITPHYNMNWPRFECFRDPVPVSRDYFLVSHAPGDVFGLYVIDRYGNRELLHLNAELGSMCPSPLQPRRRPPMVATHRDPQLASAGLGQLTLMDVYQGLEPQVARGSVKYLRVCEEVRAELRELPDGQCQADHELFQDWYATPTHKVSGPNGWPSYVAKASLGLVEVSEDGAASFTVPANHVLYFEVLDEHFNELQRMRSVVQLQAGEQRSCIGCHEPRRDAPAVQQPLRRFDEPVALSAPPWGAGPFSYERVVQPVWDAHCVSCHDAHDKQGLNLTSVLDTEKVPASYRTLISGGWVHYFDYTWQLRHHKAQPLSFGTLQSRLWQTLDNGHYDVKLSEDDVRAIKCWTDLNCPLWPDYQFRPQRGQGVVVAAELVK